MYMKRLVAATTSAAMLLGLTLILPTSENGYSASSLAKLKANFKVTEMTASAASNMRRPCSSDKPMLIVHVDTWNYADPAKIISLIPEDIKPYCVFNLSLSINWSTTEHQWKMVQDGYQCVKSWLKTCADENVWCMVQPASGGQCHLPDYDTNGNIVQFPNKGEFVSHADDDYENTIYAEFFRDYPNFIGFNYSEQFWGFGSADFPINQKQRYEHFAHLLKLCNKYGGYLNVNWCANMWSAPLNPIAMLKTCPDWKAACEAYSQNLQLEEKYTQVGMIEDVESEILGAYLSGYCGNYGVRYDDTGWTDSTWSGSGEAQKKQYRQVTSLPIYLERMAMNGATIIDGPELVWNDDFKETWSVKDSDGYSCRNWETFDQYVNDTFSFFRKMTDGTIRIPTRQEVIDRTKVVVIQDNSSGDDHNKYSTYKTLFEGLYRMPNDGNLWDNHNPFKSTGRYPTIPTVYALRDDIAKSFKVQIKQSQIASRWSSIADKQAEFNKLFASDYNGNCYASRNGNTWVAYNPNKDGSNCGAILSLKYNTCKNLDVNFNAYGTALINEYSDHINIYTNNYDEDDAKTLKTDTFKISGCSVKPTYSAKDTGRNQTASQISESYSDGTYTLTVKHNGPVEISVKCSGNETGKLTSYNTAKVTTPSSPSFYEGIRQYEGEFFDVKNVEGNVTNACGSGVTGVQGQGFLKYGKNANAAVKDTVKTKKNGTFKLNLRYSATSDTNNVDLYVNGSKVKTLALAKGSSYSDWKTDTENITLKSGENKIEFKSNSALASSLYIDNFTVSGDFGDASSTTTPTDPTTTTNPVTVQPLNGTLIKNLLVSDTDNASDWSIQNNFANGSKLYGDRDITAASVPSNLNGAEYIRTACDSKLLTTDLGKFTAAADMTVYVAMDSRVTSAAPSWLSDWTKTSAVMKTSNDLTLEVFSKNVKSGDIITLGTNSGNGNSVNYIVLASKEQAVNYGDANCDGKVDISDVVTIRRYIANPTLFPLTAQGLINSDVQGNKNGVNAQDAVAIQQSILGIAPLSVSDTSSSDNSDSSTTSAIAPDVYMKEVSAKILGNEPSSATAENSGTTYGTYKKITIDSAVCGRKKSFNVLLPAGYSQSKKYPVMYVLHGYWGNEDALLDSGDASLRLRQIIGNAIASGEAKDMIVVFPDIYASASQDKCDGLDAKNNAAYDNFINLLTKEIMPYMEKNFSIKTGRDNTAVTGFSMGGRESLYIGFKRPDLFGYVGAMCPAPGLTTDLLKDSDLKFDSVKPYLLLVSAGSNDTLIYSTPAGYHNAMDKNGTTHIWHYVNGGDHGGKTIRPHVYNFVRAVFKATN
ncbi:MAG: alpha/beta hydrolase-fold protein [Ruminococcus sp.]|nr:alpha/beta hydrolase-fold protein [Ruminococcus sp.]